jgi:hypothetical protein
MWGSGSHDPGSNPGGTTNNLVLRLVDERNLSLIHYHATH